MPLDAAGILAEIFGTYAISRRLRYPGCVGGADDDRGAIARIEVASDVWAAFHAYGQRQREEVPPWQSGAIRATTHPTAPVVEVADMAAGKWRALGGAGNVLVERL